MPESRRHHLTRTSSGRRTRRSNANARSSSPIASSSSPPSRRAMSRSARSTGRWPAWRAQAECDPTPSHDHVPLHAPRPRRRRCRVLARLDAIGPVGVHRQRPVAPRLGQPRVPDRARLPGLHPAVPGREVRVEIAEPFGNLPRGLVSQRMTSGAPVRVDHRADPLALALDVRRDAVPVRPGAGELVRSRDLEQSEPVLRRVVLRRRVGVGGRDRRDVARRSALRSTSKPARRRLSSMIRVRKPGQATAPRPPSSHRSFPGRRPSSRPCGW